MLHPTYDGVTQFLAGLSTTDLTRPTRCAGWGVSDVLVHLLADAQRALVACATPHPGPPTVDAPGYFTAWTAATSPAGDAAGARFTRIQSSAYHGKKGLLAHWSDTSGAAVRAVARLDPASCVQTQGHVLSVEELERTLVVEAAVHHLDVLLEVPGPRPVGLPVALAVFSQMAGVDLPPEDAERWVLMAAGRLPLGPADRAALADVAAAFPLLV